MAVATRPAVAQTALRRRRLAQGAVVAAVLALRLRATVGVPPRVPPHPAVPPRTPREAKWPPTLADLVEGPSGPSPAVAGAPATSTKAKSQAASEPTPIVRVT